MEKAETSLRYKTAEPHPGEIPGSQCQPPLQRGARRKRVKREKKEKRGEGRVKADIAGRGGGSWPRPCRGPGRVVSDNTMSSSRCGAEEECQGLVGEAERRRRECGERARRKPSRGTAPRPGWRGERVGKRVIRAQRSCRSRGSAEAGDEREESAEEARPRGESRAEA
eukprot:302593-Rhodomonas_salina.1